MLRVVTRDCVVAMLPSIPAPLYVLHNLLLLLFPLLPFPLLFLFFIFAGYFHIKSNDGPWVGFWVVFHEKAPLYSFPSTVKTTR